MDLLTLYTIVEVLDENVTHVHKVAVLVIHESRHVAVWALVQGVLRGNKDAGVGDRRLEAAQGSVTQRGCECVCACVSFAIRMVTFAVVGFFFLGL